MKSKRSLRSFSNTLTAAGLALAVSACSTIYQDEWNQTTDVPDLNDPMQRSQALLDYCKRLHGRGDLSLAAGICNRAHEINPTDPRPLIELAKVLEELEMTEPAEEAYRAALLLDPGQTDALYGLGKIYIDQQRYDLAMEPLGVAAQQQSEDPRIYNAMGVIMDQQGQHADAQTYYRQGLAHSPRNVSLRNNLGLSMVLDGQSEAGLAMLRDVAAEPAAGATAGRNLEMASQIAAKSAAAKANTNMTALDPAAPMQQASEVRQSPHSELSPAQELATLEPSSSIDGPDHPDSKPLPLLQPQSQARASDPAPAATPAATPPHARSLDQELADGIADETAKSEPQVSEPQVSGAVETKPHTARHTAPDTKMMPPTALMSEPAPEPASEPAAKPTSQAEARPAAAPQLAARAAAAPAPAAADPATVEDSDIPRDWSLAAQTVFATSRVAVPEPSPITPQERAAANDGFHATPAPGASPETSSPPAMTAAVDPRDDLAITPASAPKTAAETTTQTATQTAAIPEGYSIDEDTFYTAQLASFRTAARARAGWEILKETAGELLNESDAFIVRADLGGDMGTYYRVRAGTMTDHAAATQFCQELQAQGLECMPVEASWQDTNETLVDTICQTGSTGALCGTVKRSELDSKPPHHARG